MCVSIAPHVAWKGEGSVEALWALLTYRLSISSHYKSMEPHLYSTMGEEREQRGGEAICRLGGSSCMPLLSSILMFILII